MDPDAHTDSGGNNNRLLLHVWTADPGFGCLLYPGLEVADPGRVPALLRLLPLLMVRRSNVSAKKETALTHISRRWLHESSRWLVLNKKCEHAIKNLQSVAKVNGRSKESVKLDVKVRDCVIFV